MINSSDRNRLAVEALKASALVRKKFDYDLSSPINIYDLCDRADIPIRFVEINMEGMYIQLGEGVKPTILISALRPFHRKVYTCAHEYGHHFFGHGMTIDEITESKGEYTADEFLVDTFAGYLLMPPLGIRSAFIKRKLNFKTVTPFDCLLIASSFGVGYSTFIKHLSFNSYIDKAKSDVLLKTSLKNLKRNITGEDTNGTLFLIDKYYPSRTIDLETNGIVLLPNDINVDDEKYLKKYKEVATGSLFQIMNPGISRLYSRSNDWSSFVRIQKQDYIGLSKYRNLAE